MNNVLLLSTFVCLSTSAFGQSLTTPANVVVEWEYQSARSYANPFRDVDLTAEIRRPDGEVFRLPAFWAGGRTWKFRFSTPTSGEYAFATVCSDTTNQSLHQQQGALSVTPYAGDNPLYQHGGVQVSTDQGYLAHADGTPFFWLADSWWHGMTTRFRWPDDFQHLTQDRKEKGFTTIQFAVGFPCDIAPFDPRGQNEAGDPWDTAWHSINPDYFALTDLRIQHLVEQGMMPNIVGAWGYYMKWAGVDNMQQHWRYLIARYGAYPVTWTLAGEATLAWYEDLATRWPEEKATLRKQWSEVAAFVQTSDPFDRLLTVHPGPNSGDLKPINAMQHIDMVMCQSGHGGYFSLPGSVAVIREAQALYPDKPVIHGEVCFEGMEGKSGHDVQRFLFWSNMLMGTPGFSYGVEGIWQFNTEEQTFGPSPVGNVWGNVPWEIAHQYEGSREIGLGKKFLENYRWWKLTPVQNRVESQYDDVVSVPFAATIGDDHLFVYMFRKPASWQPYQINGLSPQRAYPVTWFNPITGDAIEDRFSANSAGKITIDRAPIMQDWVLVVDQSAIATGSR